MAVNWSYYDRYEGLIGRYMPWQGEGETKASQTVTAVNKLVYKWYNDGDVFDNTHGLTGWANDLSSYANWLYQHGGWAVRGVLRSVEECRVDEDYEDLLKVLADMLLKEDELERLNGEEKDGSIYKCAGPFKWEEPEEEEEYDEEDEEDWGDMGYDPYLGCVTDDV